MAAMADGSPATPGTSKGARKDIDVENINAKLIDNSFNSRKYPDPLRRQQTSNTKVYPKGITSEMEKRWLETIRASNSDTR